MDEKTIFDNTIYRVVHGSRAYGTHMPHSDRDEKGICVLPDPEYYYGNKSFDQKDSGWQDGVDRCIFDIRKFVKLALTCNPNIIEMLYVEEEDILQINDLGRLLRDNRDIFLSRKAANTFVGYAQSQLHRMEGHKRWLDNPPVEPQEDDFWKTTRLMADDNPFRIQLESHIFEVFPDVSGYPSSIAVIRHFDGEGWKAANKKYHQYQNWLKNRNPVRADLEKKFSYDAKHAGHLIRLLKMGKEIITEGVVRVRRPDAQELLDIRNGKFKYEELLDLAGKLRDEVNAAVENSPLPPEPDVNRAQQLMLSIIKQRLRS